MSKYYVLVAEDDPLLGAMVTQGFRDRGIEATAVTDGARALASVAMRRPSLVILDVAMPVIDGFGALLALRANPDLARMPILMLTAARSQADVVRARTLGASDYIVKPFTLPTLMERALVLLRERTRTGSPSPHGDAIASLVGRFGGPDRDQ